MSLHRGSILFPILTISLTLSVLTCFCLSSSSIMSPWFMLLSHLLVCVTPQSIVRNVASTIGNNEVKCTDTSSCNITCITDHSCASHNTITPFEIHCPPTSACNQCTIHCYGEHSCQNAFIYVYRCASIHITATKSYSLYGATIITSTDDTYIGHLFISNNASHMSTDNTMKTNIMSHLNIKNEYIANVSIDCYGDSVHSMHECTYLSIAKNIHSTHVSLHCHDNTDCSASELYCPMSNVYHKNNRYESPCDLHCDESSICRNISIYTQHGIPADLWLDCDDNSNVSCIDSVVFCGNQYESQCEMRYKEARNEWFCDDMNAAQSCVDLDGVYQIRTVTTSSFWTDTHYAIPMAIFVGVVVLFLIAIIARTIEQKIRERDHEMRLPYEVQDARDLEQQDVVKLCCNRVFGRLWANPYGAVPNDDLDAAQQRLELQNLKRMTRSDMHDSDDDLQLDGMMHTGQNSNDTSAYNAHTVALQDL
eukprot:19526_1